MNSDFISIHGLKDCKFDFVLPFPCRVMNLKSRAEETVNGDRLHIEVTRGESCWFRLLPNL